MARKVVIPYAPRPQFEDFHARLKRFACLVIHRRGGKTVASINDLLRGACTIKRVHPPGRFAYIAPFYKQAKSIAWDYAKHYASPIPGVKFNESELRVDLPNGARLQLFGADNADALRGGYLDGAVLDEFADWDPRVWPEIIRPMLADYKGWAVFIGTPRGHNAFYDLWKRARDDETWFTKLLRASESGLIDAQELAEASKDMTPDQIEQEFECSFSAAIQGAIYRDEIKAAEAQNRITQVPWRSELEVFTTWDLGIDDFTAIWFGQQSGREIHWIDYMEVNGLALPEIAKRLKDKPYNYGTHYLPHDVEQTELNDGRTRKETLISSGVRPIQTAPRQNVWERINATRVMFSRFWFDARNCAHPLERLRLYRREYDGDRKVFKEKPCHDDNSHAADAIGTFAQAYRDRAKAQEPQYRPRYGTMA